MESVVPYQDIFPCPCCGYLVFPAMAGSFDVCPICYWEDDDAQLLDPNHVGESNRISLIEAQNNFMEKGWSDKRFAPQVSKPTPEDQRAPGWRRVREGTDDERPLEMREEWTGEVRLKMLYYWLRFPK